MKNKGLSVLLSFVLVLMLTISFSVPVNASTASSEYIGSGYIIKSVVGMPYRTSSSIIVTQAPLVNSGTAYRHVEFLTDTFTVEAEDSCPVPWKDANGDNISIDSEHDYVRFRLNVNITPSLSSFSSPDGGYFSSNIDIKEVYVTYYGQKYYFNLVKNTNGSYDCYLTAVVDTDYPYRLTNDNMTLHIVSEISCLFDGDISVTDDIGLFGSIYPVYGLKFGTSTYFGLLTYYDDTGKLSDVDIKNQTDTLTGGFDSSSMSSSNTALSGSIAEFTGTESQITDQSFGFIDQVQFYDLNMQPQLLACITFCSSWLQSLFVNIGDWGILVMVSLSLGFGLMLVGWFKYRRK